MRIYTPLLLLLAAVCSASSQVPLVTYPPSLPTSRSYDASDYNLRLGPIRFNMDAGTEFAYTDNTSLSSTGGQSDFSIGPDLGFQAVWPVRPDRHLAVRAGVGYRYHTSLPSSSHLAINPDTSITYDIRFSDVRLTLSSAFEVNSDATSRVDLVGGAGKEPALFRQLRSQHMAALYWPIRRSLAIQTGYVLSRDASISGEFEELDSWGHSIFVAADWRARRELSLGLFSSYGVADLDSQLDASTWAVGPTLRWQPSQAVSITAHLAHTETAGQSGSSGLAARVKIDHQLRRGVNQSVAFERGSGLGSSGGLLNSTLVSYTIGAQIAPRVSVSGSFGWTSFQTQMGGLEGDQWRAGFGCNWRVSERWALYGSWSVTQRKAGGGDYVVNNLAVSIRRGF